MLKVPLAIKYATLLAFTIPLFLFTSCKDCSKKVPCPGYSDAILDAWFPYFDKEQLVFKSNTNLYDTLYLSLTDSTIAYDYTSGGFNGANKGCFATKSFTTTSRDSSNYPAFSISLNTGQDAYSTTQRRNAFIYFREKYFNGQDLGDNGFSSFSLFTGIYATPQTLINYSLQGKIYPIAQSVSIDSFTDKTAGVYKIIYAKNYGIIAYETKPNGVVWIKQ